MGTIAGQGIDTIAGLCVLHYACNLSTVIFIITNVLLLTKLDYQATLLFVLTLVTITLGYNLK